MRAFVLLIVVGAVAWRLPYGLDFTDESYYVVLALRFLDGDVPFRDELMLHQTAALLTVPWARLGIALFGREGTVLFFRWGYFLFSLGLAALLYGCLRREWERPRALLASLVAVAHVPLAIPSLSYNTLGGGFFAAGLFLLLPAEPRRGAAWAAGACFALALWCYPPFLPAVLAAAWPHRGRVAAGALPVLGLGLLVVARGSPAESLAYSLTAHGHGGGWEKAALVLRHVFWENGRLALLGLLAMPLVGALAPLFPAALFWHFHDVPYPGTWFPLYAGLAAPVAWAGRPGDRDRRLLRRVVLPAVVAGLTAAWASASSTGSGAVGIWPALAALSLWIGPRWGQGLLLVALVLGLYVGKSVYADGPIHRLTASVERGPFRGLRTTPEKRAFLEVVERALSPYREEKAPVVFYGFPAGYLLVDRPIGVNNAWMRPQSRGKAYYLKYYRERAVPGSLVAAFQRLDFGHPSPLVYEPDDPFAAFVTRTHRLVYADERMLIYRR